MASAQSKTWRSTAVAVVFGALLCPAGASLAQNGPPADARAAEWATVRTAGLTPVNATTDRHPLSDQSNGAGGVKYDPMADECGGAKLEARKWIPMNPGWKG